MRAPTLFTLKDQHLWLSPDRVIYWEEEQAIILSDLHLGKSGHFRKAGIPVPQTVFKHDLQRLFALVQHFRPTRLFVIGDFFHSHDNRELDLFSRWRTDHPGISIHLVEGNHDILSEKWYTDNQIQVHKQEFRIGPFRFRHEPLTDGTHDDEGYLICGHLHPGVRVKGMGKQSMRLPCFYFDRHQAILPAFGGFTGLYLIEPSGDSNVFAIVNNELVQLQ
ncbi:ligase-associated DNA damage response endonuclease PdeM [Flavihumibacter rivuli]|uniref:ligase-associated DNA damage response endonuclease PdeM n=1 Tax=Flavihumibacter rivuli TaxID=2838156 RepID=UPI001BDF3112|nr:ligase-associated DNA damage response endonuclease PdeM [Flavihumibacter rivuli]ULQ58210.1 ligase-associated DNA damage response endonuclease PdeM [Flavihumibacter rivuli]